MGAEVLSLPLPLNPVTLLQPRLSSFLEHIRKDIRKDKDKERLIKEPRIPPNKSRYLASTLISWNAKIKKAKMCHVPVSQWKRV